MGEATKREELFTRHGHRLDEATSALQKAVRRGLLDDALYWTVEMFGRYPHHVWRRLKVITSEDIGLAEPDLPATIDALHRAFEEQRGDKRGDGLLYTLHATALLTRAKKSRLVDHALTWFTRGPREAQHREPPDHALDEHTARGRELGAGRRALPRRGGADRRSRDRGAVVRGRGGR
jgi:replication-associated recombination protein RarA